MNNMSKEVLVAGNWKDKILSPQDVKTWFDEFSGLIQRNPAILPDMTIVIAAPHTFLYQLSQLTQETSTPILLGAQDISSNWNEDPKKTHTGEIVGPMMKNLGVKYVIIGHSERRALGEKSKLIGEKIQQALAADLIPIVCIGETDDQKKRGRTRITLAKQLRDAFRNLSESQQQQIIVAYEPIWAIGTGETATLEDVEKTAAYIKEKANVRAVIYGGSVNEKNVNDITSLPHVDGVLPGGASLKAATFFNLILSASQT